MPIKTKPVPKQRESASKKEKAPRGVAGGMNNNMYNGLHFIKPPTGLISSLLNRMSMVDSRQQTADNRQQTADNRQQTADNRQQTADNRQQTADNRQQTADNNQQANAMKKSVRFTPSTKLGGKSTKKVVNDKHVAILQKQKNK